MHATPVLRRVDHGARPALVLRQAGDRQLLIEYDSSDPGLGSNFLIHALLQRLEQEPIRGLREAVPGFRSLLLAYDPELLDREILCEQLLRLDMTVSPRDMVLQSRIIELPIAFDDEMTLEAVRRYRLTTRMDAPNVQGDCNSAYIARANGFDDREEFFSAVLSVEWWCGFTGFFGGSPSLFSLDPRSQLSAPKYNPARMWSPEGAVGIGGPAIVVYATEAPGSYQLFGRTLPIARPASPGVSVEQSHLFRMGDRVRFTRVDEKTLLELRLEVMRGTYEWRIEDSDYHVGDYFASLDAHAEQIAEVAAVRAAAAREVSIP